jgi:hypothetical protein
VTPDLLLRRVRAAAACLAELENTTLENSSVELEVWAAINHAAKILDELERDLRSDLLAQTKANA